MCYSIIWKTLTPCKFIEWNMIKKINELWLYIMFQTRIPPSFPAFLNHNITIISCFPLEAGTLQSRARDSGTATALCLGGKRKSTSSKHLAPAGPQVLYKGGNHRASLADEQLSQGDEVTCSEPLAVGQGRQALPGAGTWLLQGCRTQSQVRPSPGC